MLMISIYQSPLLSGSRCHLPESNEQIISKKLYAIVHKKKQIVAILFTTKTMLHKIKTNMLRPFRKLYFTSSTVEGDSFQANKVL